MGLLGEIFPVDVVSACQEEAVLGVPVQLSAMQSLHMQERETETGMGVEKGGETDPGTSLSCFKGTVAQWFVYSAKRKGERLCSYHLFKEDKKQFVLYLC